MAELAFSSFEYCALLVKMSYMGSFTAGELDRRVLSWAFRFYDFEIRVSSTMQL